jgi:hypothetical protein
MPNALTVFSAARQGRAAENGLNEALKALLTLRARKPRDEYVKPDCPSNTLDRHSHGFPATDTKRVDANFRVAALHGV